MPTRSHLPHLHTCIKHLLLTALSILLLAASAAHAATTREKLLDVPFAVPITEARAKALQPLVVAFGPGRLSAWEQGLFAGAIGQHDEARRWLLQAARQGDTPPQQALCLAFKLAFGTERINPDDPIGEGKKSRAAEAQIVDWYRHAAEKKEAGQTLTPEELAAWAGIESLPDEDDENVGRQRLIACRNLTHFPNLAPLYRAALAQKFALPAFAINLLGAEEESQGHFATAAQHYATASAAGFGPAATNRTRLEERRLNLPPGDKAWEALLIGYRQRAEQGDATALILQADLMERGISGPQNTDIAIQLYRMGIDALSQPNEAHEGMGAVLLGLYAQERLTEHHKAGRFKIETEAEKQKYLSMFEQLAGALSGLGKKD